MKGKNFLMHCVSVQQEPALFFSWLQMKAVPNDPQHSKSRQKQLKVDKLH